MRKKPTVTVAVCAFNEEKNILPFLKSVLRQNRHSYLLKKILVISDGSTDKTVENVNKLRSPLVELIQSKNRIGKSSHLNYIYRQLTSDYLIQTDADVIFTSKNVIEYMINPLIENKEVMMCGGNPIPREGRTFVEDAINLTTQAYRQLRYVINGGSNVFSADGRMLAYRKKFAKELYVPHDMIANDMFTYFCCKTKGYLYSFVPKAIVSYRSPKYLRDHLKQDTRFRAAPLRMEKYFTKELVQRELYVPNKTLFWLFLKYALSKPIHAIFIYSVNIFIRWTARKSESTMTAKWKMAYTTKQVV